MPISISIFGQFEGKDVPLYSLKNANGMEVKITPYGATVTSISVPDGSQRVSLAAGFDSLEGYFGEAYLKIAPYFGCTVGRYASRIKDGKFSIDGQKFLIHRACSDGIGSSDNCAWQWDGWLNYTP